MAVTKSFWMPKVYTTLYIICNFKKTQKVAAEGGGLRLEERRTAAVSEEHARVAVGPVDEAGERVAPDDENLGVRAAPDVVRARDQRHDEAAARGGDVECNRIGRPDVRLDRARRAEDVVRA